MAGGGINRAAGLKRYETSLKLIPSFGRAFDLSPNSSAPRLKLFLVLGTYGDRKAFVSSPFNVLALTSKASIASSKSSIAQFSVERDSYES